MTATASPVRRPSPFVLTVATASALLLLFLSVPNFGPAVRAARGEGTAGVFTATRVSCVSHPGHEACSWYGSFRSADGVRPDISLYGADREALRPGAEVRAVSVAGRPDRVYGPGGSMEWLFVAVLLLVGLALLVPLARTLLRPYRI